MAWRVTDKSLIMEQIPSDTDEDDDDDAEEVVWEFCDCPAPEIYEISMEKYMRRFAEIPPDFVQISEDICKPTTPTEIAKSLVHDVIDCKRHVMFVGGPGSGKSTIAQSIIEKIEDAEPKTVVKRTDFAIDLRYYSGAEIYFVPFFLFNRHGNHEGKPGVRDTDSSEYQYAITHKKSPFLRFLLDGLDSLRCKFEDTAEEITLKSYASVSTIVCNLLSGKLLPKCRIVSTCRDFRLYYFHQKIYPHRLVLVGELADIIVRELMLQICGDKCGKKFYFSSRKRSPAFHMLNRTVNNLICNLLSANCGKSYTLPEVVPMTVLNYVGSYTSPVKPNGENERVLPIIHKMMKAAYWGTLMSKRLFTEAELFEDFNLSRQDVEAVIAQCLMSDTKFTMMRAGLPGRRIAFVDSLVQEFLCALYVAGLPISEYNVFLDEKLHLKRCHVVRQMVCSVILDPFVTETAMKEGLIGDLEDIALRRELLRKSMAAEFSKAKRWDLLQFFHAIRDCRDAGANLGIIPREIDLIDLSHIPLFALDMQAIGASLVNVHLGCLDLSNCEVASDGMHALSEALHNHSTRIHTFKLDWNRQWCKSTKGVKALRNMIRNCAIAEISWNNAKIDADLLIGINLFLGDVEFDTLRMEHNGPLTNQGYENLGEFITKHRVKDLYITAGNMTKEQIGKLNREESEMKMVMTDGREIDMENSDFNLF